MKEDAQWGEPLAGIIEELVSDFDLSTLLHRVADVGVEVCGASGAGIVVADTGGALRDVAYSSEAIRQLERFQLQADEGPCVECFNTGVLVEESDMAAATDRWPRFAPEAFRLGIRSARALPLRLRGRTVGALNLFHAEPGPCPDTLLLAARSLADLAMLGLAGYGSGASAAGSVEDRIKAALAERSQIERAKGMLAELGGVGMDESFALLWGYAAEQGLGLAEVAEGISDRTVDVDALLALRPTALRTVPRVAPKGEQGLGGGA